MFNYLKLSALTFVGAFLLFSCSPEQLTLGCSTTLSGTINVQNPCNQPAGLSVVYFEKGKFIFDCNNHTITLSTNLNVTSIDLLKFDQPASQCIIESPSFSQPPFASTYYMVQINHPEFWDCVGDGGAEFCFEFSHCIEAQSWEELEEE